MKKTLILFILYFSINPNSINNAQIGDGVKSENVMAVYIYNFTKFLKWPKDDSEYFHIYVMGKSNLIEPLNKIAEKEKINGRKIIIDPLENISNIRNNSMLFISNIETSKLNSILKKSVEKNILTISNSVGLADKGVCINFLLADNKIKFEINLRSMEKAGIIPNTRLLSLAVKVYE